LLIISCEDNMNKMWYVILQLFKDRFVKKEKFEFMGSSVKIHSTSHLVNSKNISVGDNCKIGIGGYLGTQ